MKKAFYSLKNAIIAHPAWFFLVAALLWGGFMCFLNYKDGADFSWHDLLVEANGMVFDLLVFGVLLSIYEALREKRDKIERLHEEIDDYRGWDEKEATYRIVGAVRRLRKLGVSSFDLSCCFLQEVNLHWENLQEIDFYGANLQRANLKKADLRKANLSYASLEGANLEEANLEGANLRSAKFQKANFQKANLSGTDIVAAHLEEAILKGANLRGAVLQMAYLQGADLQGADLRKADLHMAFLQGINLNGAYLRGINLKGAATWETNFDGAIVGISWFEELEERQKTIIGSKYLIDENGVLREKQ